MRCMLKSSLCQKPLAHRLLNLVLVLSLQCKSLHLVKFHVLPNYKDRSNVFLSMEEHLLCRSQVHHSPPSIKKDLMESLLGKPFSAWNTGKLDITELGGLLVWLSARQLLMHSGYSLMADHLLWLQKIPGILLSISNESITDSSVGKCPRCWRINNPEPMVT